METDTKTVRLRMELIQRSLLFLSRFSGASLISFADVEFKRIEQILRCTESVLEAFKLTDTIEEEPPTGGCPGCSKCPHVN